MYSYLLGHLDVKAVINMNHFILNSSLKETNTETITTILQLMKSLPTSIDGGHMMLLVMRNTSAFQSKIHGTQQKEEFLSINTPLTV